MLRILFASQSGTAEEYAERIAHEAYTRGLDYTFGCLNGFEVTDVDPANDVIIIVCSTTGDGEMPINGRAFWQWLLQSTIPTDLLAGFTFAILAVGDSSYEKFNYAGKMLHRRIEQLGGSMLVDRADADEQHPFGHDGVFTSWSGTLWKLIESKYPTCRPNSLNHPQPKARLEFVDSTKNYDYPAMRVLPIEATVSRNSRITAEDHFQDVRHLEFILDDASENSWLPGDVAVLMPCNNDDLVEETIEAFGWNNDELLPVSPFIIHPRRPEFRFSWSGLEGTPVTLRHLLKHHLDIRKPPKRSFFRILAQVTRDQMNKMNDDHSQLELFVEKLEELASPDGLDLYLSFVWRPKRMPHEILNDFSLLRGLIPIDWIFDLFPWIHPREYSISSCSIPDPRSPSQKPPLSVTAALVQYTTLKSLPERWGLCSEWLSQLQVGSKITLDIRPGVWREAITTDSNPKRPWIMIAAGTGVAPMRSLIQQEIRQGHGRPLYLFFGCRFIEKDYLYKDEWQSYGDDLQVFAMGSRDQGGSRRHLPVLLKQHQDLLSRLIIDDEARIFVAGNSKLPRLIKETINEICGDPDLSDALIKLDRLHIEAWS